MFQVLFDKGELALGLEWQRLSVELIPLPELWRSGHGNHEIDRLLAIGSGCIEIPTQRMDASAQGRVETGGSDALTGKPPFEIAPFIFQREHLIPAIQAEGTLALQTDRGGLLANRLGSKGQGFCFL